MSIKYIVFDNRSDEAEGLVALARKTRVDALPGGVYRVCDDDLVILRDLDSGAGGGTAEAYGELSI